MGKQESTMPKVVVGVAVVVIAAVAAAVRLTHHAAAAPSTSPAAATSEERPIPTSPWQGEAQAPSSGADGGGLQLVSDATMGQSATDIAAAAATAALDATQAPSPAAEDPMHTMRIDGTSLDTMVDSINKITASLAPADAKAFQKAVRVIMVASLPIEQMRAQKVAVDKIPSEQLIAGARKVLAGRTPLEVLKMAQARINAELAKRAKGNGLDAGEPLSAAPLAR